METGTLQSIDRQPNQDYDRIQVDNRWGYYWSSLQDLSEGDTVKYERNDWTKDDGGTGTTFEKLQKVETPNPKNDSKTGKQAQDEGMSRGLAIKCGSTLAAGTDNPTAERAIEEAEKILDWYQNGGKK